MIFISFQIGISFSSIPLRKFLSIKHVMSLRQYINFLRPKGKTEAVFLTQRRGKMDRVTEAMDAMKRALIEDGAFAPEDLAGLTAKDFRCIT